jgi:hypothetical protein
VIVPSRSPALKTSESEAELERGEEGVTLEELQADLE